MGQISVKVISVLKLRTIHVDKYAIFGNYIINCR